MRSEASGRAEPLKDIGRGTPALLDGGDETKQVVPALANRLEGDIVLQDIGDGCRHFEASRQVQMPIAQAVEAWAQIEPEELRDGHAEVGIAVRIDREPLETRERLAHGALDRGAGLAGREQQRLVVDDAPLVKYVRVGSDRMAPALRIDPCHPHVTADIQAHQIAGGLVAITPLLRQRLGQQERDDDVVRATQCALLLKHQRSTPDRGQTYTRDHHRDIGAVKRHRRDQDRRIQRDQLLGSRRCATEQLPGEVRLAVDSEQELGQLCTTYARVEAYAAARHRHAPRSRPGHRAVRRGLRAGSSARRPLPRLRARAALSSAQSRAGGPPRAELETGNGGAAHGDPAAKARRNAVPRTGSAHAETDAIPGMTTAAYALATPTRWRRAYDQPT